MLNCPGCWHAHILAEKITSFSFSVVKLNYYENQEMRNLFPDVAPGNLSRYKLSRGVTVPALIFLICCQFLLLQIVLAWKASDANRIVKQDLDNKQNVALTLSLNNLGEPDKPDKMNSDLDVSNSQPGVLPNTCQPVVSPTPGEGVVLTVSQAPPVHREEILRSVPTAGKKVAITFDDGPSSRYTMEYLRVLRENQVPATFFLVGRNAQKYPCLVTMIAGEGHEIGNHTFDHPNLKKQKEKIIAEQISRTSDLLTQWTQQEVKFVRPPGGNISSELIKVVSEMNLQIVMWTIDPRDWEKNKTSDEIIDFVKKNIQPGAIILLHEGKPQTLAALPILINDLRKDGWEFVTISGLLGEVINEST